MIGNLSLGPTKVQHNPLFPLALLHKHKESGYRLPLNGHHRQAHAVSQSCSSIIETIEPGVLTPHGPHWSPSNLDAGWVVFHLVLGPRWPIARGVGKQKEPQETWKRGHWEMTRAESFLCMGCFLADDLGADDLMGSQLMLLCRL